jgi:hypothetical protein
VKSLGTDLVPLAVLGAAEEPDSSVDLPLAYVPRIPQGPTFRDVIERAVGWGRR